MIITLSDTIIMENMQLDAHGVDLPGAKNLVPDVDKYANGSMWTSTVIAPIVES